MAVSAVTLAAASLRNKEQRQLKAALDDWEGEGGSVAAINVAAGLISAMSRAQCSRYGNVTIGSQMAMNKRPTADSDRPDEAGHSHACPRCNGPAYRVPRRLVDLLMSIFISVNRYRCRSMSCGREGNLRVKRHPLLVRGPW